jgi:signal transduction histidine kinase
VAIGGAALCLAVAAFAVPLSARTLVHPVGFSALVAWSVLAWVLAGLLWLRARPWSRIGPLLCVLGLLLGLQSFQGSANSYAFSVAVILDALVVLLAWYLVAIFPGSRLDAPGRRVMAFAAAVVVPAFVLEILFSSSIAGATPLARCGDMCPPNQLLISSEPGLAGVIGDIERWSRVGFTLMLLTLLAFRFKRASPPRRMTMLPVYAAVGLWLTAFSVYNAAANAGASVETLDGLGVGVSFSRSLYPLGFIAAIVLTWAHAGAALQVMVGRLGRDSTLRSVERAVRDVLKDPSARLYFWPEEGRGYVDSRAEPAEGPVAGGEQSLQRFGTRDGRPVVAIVYDPVLDEYPELLQATGEAVVLALENRRLDEELRQSREALVHSERRLGSAVAAERRRIERDLHDGSQQRLVAIRIGLELARERAAGDQESRARLAKLGEQLDQAVEELRGLAQGIYPSVLPDFGLRTALEAAAGRSGVALMETALQEVPRYPAHTEAGVYFACVEALQNAAKHAGPAAHVKVSLWTEGNRLCFSVADDGVGFARGRVRQGSGLRNMAERLAGLDGTFTLDSAPGRGTVAAGSVPVERLAPL